MFFYSIFFFLQLITVKKKCPRYEKELKEAYQSEEMKRINTGIADLYNYLSANTGQNISTVLEVEFLFNTLEIEVTWLIACVLSDLHKFCS